MTARTPSFPPEAAVGRRGSGCAEARGAASAGAIAALKAAAAREGGAELPVCPTWVANVEEMLAWLKSARPGEEFVYCVGADINRGPASRLARDLYLQGKVELLQPPAAYCRGREWKIRRRAEPKKAKAAEKRAIDARALAVFAAIKEAAERDRRCPSNRRLAELAGLASPQLAGQMVQALAAAGLFAVETERRGPDGPWRVVRLNDGRSTALPSRSSQSGTLSRASGGRR